MIVDDYNISNVIATWHTEGLFYNYLQHTTDNVGQGCPVDHDCTRYVQVLYSLSLSLSLSLPVCLCSIQTAAKHYRT